MATTKKRFVKVKYTNTLPHDYGWGSSSITKNKLYLYEDSLKTPLQEFDVVIAPTQYGDALAVVYEVGVSKGSVTSVKSIAEKIESKTLDDKLKVERAKALRKKIETKIKEVNEIEMFKLAAKNNPELQAMVDALEALQAGEQQ